MNIRALAAELIGTFMLVASIVLVALFSAPAVGNNLGVALSVGLTVMALAYALGPISGGHFNPAVTIGLVAAGRFDAGQSVGYIVAQCIGALLATTAVFLIASGSPAPVNLGNFASNAFNTKSTFTLTAVLAIEVLLTAVFLIVIVGATSPKAPAGFAPIAIGLTLGAIHIMAIPISNCSVNPARSLATAVFGGPLALQQVWVFWVAPLVGGVIGGVIARWLHEDT
jgi:aquaporin Z